MWPKLRSKSVSYTHLEMRYIRKCLYMVLRNMPQIDMQSDMAAELFGDKLLNQLAQYNINVIYNRNSAGIVGISFGRPDLTFKGSELKLSWETILHYVRSKRGVSAKKKPIPVSYTHLDVYKRQVSYSSFASPRTIFIIAHLKVMFL